MIISGYGLSALKMEAKGTVLVTNPYDKTSGFSAPRFEAQIVVASQEKYAESSIVGNPQIFSLPGEYDSAGITIQGFQITPTWTAFLIEWEELDILFLGDGENVPAEDVDRALKDISEGVDILVLPVGDAFGAKAASALIQSIEPRIVVPTRYNLKGSSEKLDTLEAFLKASGLKADFMDKYSIKKKDLPPTGPVCIVVSSPYDK